MKQVIALGFFDGVHLGHAALLNTAARRARELNARACAVTLDRHPSACFGAVPVGLICTPAERQRLMQELCGIDEVRFARFDREMIRTPWDVFLAQLQAAHLICGQNYRFGAGGVGTAEMLRDWCAAHNVGCDVIDEVCLEGGPVSSTRIRTCLEQGQTELANRLLGHPYRVDGIVQDGQHLGRTLGIPTANIPLPEGLLSPARGAYAARVRVGTQIYSAVMNLGTRPTVHGKGILLESWLLDFSGDLYGRRIEVELHRFLRPERTFASLTQLHDEILRNAAQTRAYFAGASGI